MRQFIALSIVTLVLSGCYKFESPPFSDKDLKSISSTVFGREVLTAVNKMRPGQKSPLSEFKEKFSSDSKVLELNDEFLVMQENEKGHWNISVLMKNTSHIFVCTLMGNEEVQIPASIKIEKKKEMIGEESFVSGPSEDLKKFAMELVDTSLKMCAGMPYTTSRQAEIKTDPWWKFWK